MHADELFTWPDELPFGGFFPGNVDPWKWVSAIKEALAAFPFVPTQELSIPSGVAIGERVFIHPSVRLPPYCVIEGPAYIAEDCVIRPSAYIRSNVIAGPGCVLGNSCEYKNALLLKNVETAHFNYVGDSVLGQRAHLGAGVICANLKLARDEVKACSREGRVSTGMRKLGALIGDEAEVGCNSVLQPGAILGRRSAVLTMSFHGYLEEDTIVLPKVEPQRIPRRRT